MKKLTFLLLTVFTVLFIPILRAERITIEKAEDVAKSFAKSSPTINSDKDLKFIRLATKTQKLSLRSAALQEAVLYYVFSMDDDHGFIIISGDDIATPVLGYAENGIYDESNLNFNYWMDCLAKEIAEAIERNMPQSKTIKAQWDEYLPDNVPDLSVRAAIRPIITTQWNQNSPYNDLCPQVSGVSSSYGGRAPTGCTATAMA